MNELATLNSTLNQLEKLLYGINYETHFQSKLISKSPDLQIAVNRLNADYTKNLRSTDLHRVSYPGLKKQIIDHFSYKGFKSSGPELSPARQEELTSTVNKLWQVLQQKFNLSSTAIYSLPEIQTWIFWGFCFFIVSKERNAIYLFEGGASD